MYITEIELYRLLNAIPVALSVNAVTDMRYIYVNDCFERVTGYSRGKITGRTPLDINLKIDLEQPAAKNQQAAFTAKTGEKRVCLVTSATAELGGNRCIIMTMEDITALRQAEDELQSLLLVDELTGLYNRRGFVTLGQHQLKIARRMNKDMLLLFADIDGLSRINGGLGRQEGDRALIDTANILKSTFREPDIIARIGGDEFAALVIEASKDHTESISIRFRENLMLHNKKMKRLYKLSVSIGVAHYEPGRPGLINELMEKAGGRMYKRKRK